MSEEKEKPVEEAKKDNYELVKVPTGEALAIKTPEGEYISTEMAMVEILNIVKDTQEEIGKWLE